MDKQYTYRSSQFAFWIDHNYITYFTYEIFGDLEIYILIMKSL